MNPISDNRTRYRALHVVASLDKHMGGSVRAPLDICRSLMERGGSVFIVATTGPHDEIDYLTEEYPGVRYHVFPRRFPEHNFRSPSLRRWLRDNVASHDLVEIHGVFSFVPLYAAWACVRTRTPYTVRPHGSLDPFDLTKHALLKQAFGRLAVRPVLRRCRYVVLTSNLEDERLVTFGASPRRVVMPLPVPAPVGHGDGTEFRRRYGIPVDSAVVLFMGRIDVKKGLQFLIPALASLKSRHSDLWFVLAGSGSSVDVQRVRVLLHQHGVSEWTTECGFVSGSLKRSALAASDVFALPSLNENLGIALIEAMHAGLPAVVSTEVYIHDELVKAGAAVSCEPSYESCESALSDLLADPARRRVMGQRAREVARTFEPDHVLPPLEELYRSMTNGADDG